MVRRQDKAEGVLVCARESAHYRHPLSPRREWAWGHGTVRTEISMSSSAVVVMVEVGEGCV